MNLHTIYEQLQNDFPEMQQIRRHLHMHPELSFHEIETAAFIANYYENLGISYETNVGGNGIVARFKGALPGKTVALRADFDALPIQDEKDVPYRSTVAGVTHACGHDGHTATLLVLAKTLYTNRSQLAGTFVFIHQFGEEVTPGGATQMVQAGCLTGVDAIFGTHLWSPFESGTIHYCNGPMMAGADVFTIQLCGEGGHGAAPHKTIDAITLGADVVTRLQQIISRKIDPTQPAVLTIGKFAAGDAFNIIAGKATLRGTVRTFNTDVREQIIEEMDRVLQGVCLAAGATYTFDYDRGFPPVINHLAETQFLVEQAQTIPNIGTIQQMDACMIGEDFSYYLNEIPGSFFFTGASLKNGVSYPHHHPKFDFDEEAMIAAAKTLATVAVNYTVKK